MSQQKLYTEELRKKAEAAWEGCHHCDEYDREFWINGYITGALQMEVDREYETKAYWFGRGILAGKENRIKELKPQRK